MEAASAAQKDRLSGLRGDGLTLVTSAAGAAGLTPAEAREGSAVLAGARRLTAETQGEHEPKMAAFR